MNYIWFLSSLFLGYEKLCWKYLFLEMVWMQCGITCGPNENKFIVLKVVKCHELWVCGCVDVCMFDEAECFCAKIF